MMRKGLVPPLSIIGIVAWTLTLLHGAAWARDKVDIAIIAPLSGPNASVGEMIVNAAKLAVDDVNKAGGVKSLGGARLNPVIADTTDDPRRTIAIADETLSRHKVAAAFGLALSPLTMAALPAFVKHRVPLVTSAVSDGLVTPANAGYLFQIAPKGSAFGNQQIEFLRFLNEKCGMAITKAAIVYVDDSYGNAVQKGIEQLARQAGLQIALKAAYPQNLTDAGPVVAEIERSGAQVLFPASYIADAGLLLRTLRRSGSHVLVIGGGAGFIWPAIGQTLGDKIDGLTSVASWNLDSRNIASDAKLADVARRYMNSYGTFMPEQAGEAYAGVSLLAAAIDAARSADPTKVRAALTTIDVTSGGGALMQPGEVAFEANGANRHVMPVIIQWQGGVPHTVFPEAVATSTVTKP